MNTFNLVIVFISIGVIVIASLAGICAVLLELERQMRQQLVATQVLGHREHIT